MRRHALHVRNAIVHLSQPSSIFQSSSASARQGCAKWAISTAEQFQQPLIPARPVVTHAQQKEPLALRSDTRTLELFVGEGSAFSRLHGVKVCAIESRSHVANKMWEVGWYLVS